VPRFTARERRERYLREYEFQKKTGKPFFPYAIYHDTVMSLVVVALIVGMAILWHSGFHHAAANVDNGRAGGFLGPAYEDRADPGTTSYDPRPEWYFFFLFELLRLFQNPNLILFGTIIIPTIMMILLFAWPFLDRRPERRVSRRPIAMTVGAAVPVILLALTWYGSKAPAVGASSNHPGALAVSTNCGSCHALKDAGIGGNIGPNLDNAKPDFSLAVNRITNGKGVMPSFKAQGLNDAQIKCMAGYVATYAGAVGAAKGPKAATAKGYPASCTAAGKDYTGVSPPGP